MKILLMILVCVMLTACGNAAAETDAEETSQTSQAAETSAAPAETVSVTAEEKAEIQALLTEAGKFAYDYLDCKEIIKHVNTEEYITTTGIGGAGFEGQVLPDTQNAKK